VAAMRTKREPLNAIWRFRQYDDTYRWQHLKAEPTTDSDSTAVTWYILGVDVDEQFKAQEAPKVSEQEAREILDRIPAMISIRTEEGIAYTNRRLSDRVGAVLLIFAMETILSTYIPKTARL
jgi:PAS domain-containing protein